VPRPRYHKLNHPSPKVERYLGSLESQVMDFFWRSESGTVRDVVEHLERNRPVVYNTVLTVMSRLTNKGLLSRDLRGRTYLYHAARSREEFLGEMSGQIVDDLLKDFGDVAIAQFLSRMEQVAPGKLAALLRLAREHAEDTDER
jgi:predicted transcriptional regulator